MFCLTISTLLCQLFAAAPVTNRTPPQFYSTTMVFGNIMGLFGADKPKKTPQPATDPPIDDFVLVFPAAPTIQTPTAPTGTAPTNTAAATIAAFGEGIFDKLNLPIVHRTRTGLVVIVLGYPEPVFKARPLHLGALTAP